MKYLFGYMNPFMSSISGRFVSISQIPSLGSQDYIIIGDRNGNAIVSPALIDVKLDIIELRNLLDRLRKLRFILQQSDTMAPYAQALNQLDSGFLYNNADGVLSIQVPGGGTVALPYGQVFVGDIEDLAQPTQLLHKQLLLGDENDRAVPTTILYFDNLPNLTNKRIIRGNLSDRPEESDDLTNLETEIYGPGGLLDTLADLATLVNTINTTLGALEATVAGIELGLATIGGFAAILLLQAQVLGLLGSVTALDIRLTEVEDRLDNLRLNNIPADGDVSFYDYKLINLADPENDTDGVNLRTLTTAIEGITHDIIPLLPVRAPCRVATTGSFGATYDNGVGGVGATLTNSGPPGPLTIEGIPLGLNERLLVKDQLDPWQNGIYFVENTGEIFPENWVIKRATDFDGSAEGPILKGITLDIVEGTINGQSSWMQTGDGPFTVGTTPIIFSGYPGQYSITKVGTLTEGTWQASIHEMLYGGTGAALTGSNGGIVYSEVSNLAIMPGTSTPFRIVMSGSLSAPTWSNAAYPQSTTINQLLYSPTANNISGLPTANNGALITNSLGVPSILSAVANSVVLMTPSFGSPTPSWQSIASNFVTSIFGTPNQVTVSSNTGLVTLSLPGIVTVATSIAAGTLKMLGTTNTLQSTNANGNILIAPNGSGTTSFINNVGFGTSTPHSAIQTSNSINNRVFTLWEENNNNHEFYGLGINGGVLRYQAYAGASHVWYISTSATTSQEVMRCNAGGNGGTGIVGINQSSPLAGLHVVGGVRNVANEDSGVRIESSSNSAKIELRNTSINGKHYDIYSDNLGNFNIYDRTSTSLKIRMNSTGVSFGAIATSPAYPGDCSGTFRAPRLIGNAGAPTITIPVIAGLAATSSIVGCEVSGRFSINFTSFPITNTLISITFTLSSAMPNTNYSVILEAGNGFASPLNPLGQSVFVSITSTTQFTVNMQVPLLPTTGTYTWHYHIIGSHS
jgi:hypothetical protein